MKWRLWLLKDYCKHNGFGERIVIFEVDFLEVEG